MNALPEELFQSWSHSYEEDASGVTVYRPSGYALPPARGRAGIEFNSDGTVIDWPVGAADAPQGAQGHWHITGPGRLQITYEGSDREPTVIEIVEINKDVLKIKQL